MPSNNSKNTQPIALVTGATGMVGRVLVPALQAKGYTVRTLVRDKTLVGGDAFYWQPDAGEIDVTALEGAAVVFHLAGTGIADKRWSAGRMAYLLRNRAGAAATLRQGFEKAKNPPPVAVIASAIGFYGHENTCVMTEDSLRGSGFAGDVCAAIEANFPAESAARVVHARLGVVLGHGGALAKMLPAFKLGLGGKLGSGAQPFAWVGITDAVEGLIACAENKKLNGAVNVVAPAQDTNASFTQALGKALRRPVIFPMPAFVARILFGQMGEELLLNGAFVAPEKLLQTGFVFTHETLGTALPAALKR